VGGWFEPVDIILQKANVRPAWTLLGYMAHVAFTRCHRCRARHRQAGAGRAGDRWPGPLVPQGTRRNAYPAAVSEPPRPRRAGELGSRHCPALAEDPQGKAGCTLNVEMSGCSQCIVCTVMHLSRCRASWTASNSLLGTGLSRQLCANGGCGQCSTTYATKGAWTCVQQRACRRAPGSRRCCMPASDLQTITQNSEFLAACLVTRSAAEACHRFGDATLLGVLLHDARPSLFILGVYVSVDHRTVASGPPGLR
jgi:hypothetical protein